MVLVARSWRKRPGFDSQNQSIELQQLAIVAMIYSLILLLKYGSLIIMRHLI